MDPVIRIDIDAIRSANKPLIVDLGCGNSKVKGRIGIDKIDLPTVDIVADVEEGLPFFPDSSVDEIHSRSFFEHVSNLEGLIREIVRILKPSGTCHVFVPHFSNPYFYSDYTHSKFIGLYTFYYFSDEKYQLKRKVPNFYSDVRIRILQQTLTFGNPSRQTLFKKILQHLFNRSSDMQEFYEENLCYIFPCYGLELVFTPDGDQGESP
jgi:predicted SAM-dependent methyltransferase